MLAYSHLPASLHSKYYILSNILKVPWSLCKIAASQMGLGAMGLICTTCKKRQDKSPPCVRACARRGGYVGGLGAGGVLSPGSMHRHQHIAEWTCPDQSRAESHGCGHCQSCAWCSCTGGSENDCGPWGRDQRLTWRSECCCR